MSEPRWLQYARGEVGTREVAGAANNPRIVRYWFDGGMPWVRDDSTPWCSGFANAMLARAGFPGSGKANARSFQTWGREVGPKLGAVVVLSRPPVAWHGHVGFLVAHTDTTVTLVGGNQSDQVSYATFPKKRVLGYRWPSSPAAPEPTSAPIGERGEASRRED